MVAVTFRTAFVSASQTDIIHLTTVHPRGDIRIAVKQAATLASTFPGRVGLLVADGLGAEQCRGVRISDLGSVGPSKLVRPFQGFRRALRFLRSCRPSVLHFHDPELIPVGIAAKAMGIRVIYDVHEDVPRQLLGRESLGVISRQVLAAGAQVAEWIAARLFDAIVCATPRIAARFPSEKTTVVQNFPILAELEVTKPRPYRDRPHRFVYVGVITTARGAGEMVDAVAGFAPDAGVELRLAGPCRPQSLETTLQGRAGDANVKLEGWMDRPQVAGLLDTARAGLVLFHAAPNHVNAQPNKLFEYLSVGLPVIASDFPLWRELVEQYRCGLLVDPADPQAINKAMEWILEHPEEAEAMGQNGRHAVESRLNWRQESQKLISVYEGILGAVARGAAA